MANLVQEHYEAYPYPVYPLFASVRRCDTYALNIDALWARFNSRLAPKEARKILIAGSGTFSPYPWSVANPDLPITALDLSKRSLRRARLHCLLHGCNNIEYSCGDLSNDLAIDGKFGVIDSYGVLHHLDDPLSGLKNLEGHLAEGGIIRIMLYSRYARRNEESIRRAFRLLGVNSPTLASGLLKKAVPGSRLAQYLKFSDEHSTLSGLADALLHPKVRTYRVDELLELIGNTGLELLMFAHNGALQDPKAEIERLKSLEKERYSPGNFVLYLGKNTNIESMNVGKSMIMLNPCLTSAVSHFKFGTLNISRRLGFDNPPLSYSDRSFLRKFIDPIDSIELSDSDSVKVAIYKRQLFLLKYRNNYNLSL